jgi:superfamily II DNA or RNA helicase
MRALFARIPLDDTTSLPTTSEIRSALGHIAAERGAEYQRAGRVRITEIDAAGAHLRAQVHGSKSKPYEVDVRLARGARGLQLRTLCTCPMAGGCKHVAATLLEFAARPRPAPEPPAQTTAGELPASVVAWLAQVDVARGGEDAPPGARQRIIYVITVKPAGKIEQLMVQPVSVRVLKDGKLSGAATPYQASQALLPQPPRFLRPSDVEILAAIHREHLRAQYYASHGTVIAGAGSGRLLEEMVATGRCHWESAASPPLKPGAAREARESWSVDGDGEQRLVFGGDGIDVVVPVSPPFYVDVADGLCGRIASDLSEPVMAALVAAPPVSPAAAPLLAAELARRFPARTSIQPQATGPTRRVGGAPGVHLALSLASFPRHQARPGEGGASVRVILGRLSFDYGGERIGAELRGGAISLRHEGEVVVVDRDLEAEAEARRELEKTRMFPASGWSDQYRVPAADRACWVAPVGESDALAMDFLGAALPRWRELGWQVETPSDWKFKLLELDSDLSIELQESSGLDWFELDLGAIVDGKRVNLLPALLPLLGAFNEDVARHGTAEAVRRFEANAGHATLRLQDGRRAALPYARLTPFIVALCELLGSESATGDGKVRLSRARAGELAAREAAGDAHAKLRWVGGERLRAFARRLRDGASVASGAVVEPPRGFVGDLRGYQRDGVSWLQFLRESGLNGILADDMGLGKTVQTLAHLLIEKEAGRADRPSLVVAPTSLIANWRHEAQRFAPGLRVMVWHGAAREREQLAGAELIVTSYALLARDRQILSELEFHLVVLDEAQAIKNPLAHATQAVQTLTARHRLCLSGTPLENHLGELWSLMNFLNPGLLGTRARFARDFRTPIEKLGDEARRAALVARVRPFLLRRTKDAVERDLPAKTEIVERLEFEQPQRDLYESVRLAAYGRVRDEIAARGLGRSQVVILDALLKLRQVCCDPRLLALDHAGRAARSAKLDRLMEMVPELLSEGRRILIFSQFTSMLALIEQALGESGIDYVKLTGETTDRATPVRRFQAGEVPVFLISLKAGGTGLNLTAADTVILYDPWWNPAAEAQAIDRAHRIGQDKPVFAYRLIALGTVEEKMQELQARKRALADALLAGSASTVAQITEADLEALFAPLE